MACIFIGISSMKNITITLETDTAQRVRVRAAERNLSVSRYIGELVRKDIRESSEYQDAMKRYFSSNLVIRLQPGERYPTREELYDRGTPRKGAHD
jgi:hypothetical protein